MKRSILLCVALAAGIQVACAAQESRPKWTLKQSDFDPIKPQTAKQEVERRLGKPLVATRFPRLKEEVWDYRYMDGVQTSVAEIHFDEQGRATRTVFYPDRCPFRPVPCR
jgi:hypothetical protein